MTSRTYVALRIASLAIATPGCADVDDGGAPEPRVAVIYANQQPVPVEAEIRSINGSYGAGCDGRQGDWSLAVVAPSGELQGPPLETFATDLDVACDLTLTEVVARPVGGSGPQSDLTYAASSGIVLGGAFAGQAVAFVTGGSTGFYGNARLVRSSNPQVDWQLELRVSPSVKFGEVQIDEQGP